MKNEFMGVLEAKKGGLKMGEKEHIKQSHSRGCVCGSHFRDLPPMLLQL